MTAASSGGSAATVGQLLRLPEVAVMLAASVAGRLPVNMANLAILLALGRHSGLGRAAGIAAAFAGAFAVTAQPKGRIADAHGQSRLLGVCAVVCAPALAVLAVPGLDPAAQVVFAVLAGAALPPIGAATRAVWSQQFRGTPTLAVAFTLDAVISELAIVAGTLLVTAAAAAGGGGTAALLVTAALVLAGGLGFAATGPCRRWRGTGRRARGLGPLALAPVRLVAVTMLLTSAAIGAMTVGVVALSRAQGHPDRAGLLLSASAVGSVAGSVAATRLRSRSGGLPARYAVLLGLFAAGLVPLAVARSFPAVTAVLVIGFLFAAPTYVLVSQLLDALTPAAVVTEAFTLAPTTNWAGQGIGTAAAGATAAHLTLGLTLSMPAMSLVAAALLVTAARQRLRPSKAGQPPK